MFGGPQQRLRRKDMPLADSQAYCQPAILPMDHKLSEHEANLAMQTGDNKDMTANYQVTLVDEQQHMFVTSILLDMLLQVPAACAQRVPCIQNLQHQTAHEA